MMCFTVLYKMDDHKIVAPLVVSSCAFLMISIYPLYSLWKFVNKTVDVYPAMICWSIWLAYGIVFKGTGGEIPEVANVVSAVCLMMLSASLYKPGLYDNPTFRVMLVVMYAFLILFFPNEDSIAGDCGTTWILFKVTLFYCLYVASIMEGKLMARTWLHSKVISQRKSDIKNIRPFGGEKLFYHSVERTILQSLWVLFVKWYFVVFAVAACIGISVWIKKQTEVYMFYKKNDSGGRDKEDVESGRICAIQGEVSTQSFENIVLEDLSEYAGSDDGNNIGEVHIEEI